MTIVKFCGFREADDVGEAIRVGADLIGLNFVPSSRRVIDIESARKFVDQYGSATLFVGVFMNATSNEVQQVIDNVNLDFLQFHSNESGEVL